MTRNSLNTDTKRQKTDSFRHDLRTHLSAIVSLTDLIRKSEDQQKTAALIEALHFAASNAMTMVEGGTELYKQPKQETILLSCWLKEFEGLASLLANSHGARFQLAISSDLEDSAPLAPAPGYLHRTLMLLLDNALKYAQQATITLTAALKSDTEILLTVCDDGPGFQEQIPELLFEPYHRGEGQSASDGKGLGLWSARHILSVMGGTITAQENTPHGACFLITLPLEQARLPEPEKSKPSRPSIKRALAEKQGEDKERAKILIVDDNKTNLLILAEILKALGFSPITAQSGSEALELLKHIQPDLAIFDIRMDGMSGWDLIKQLKQEKNHTALPVVAISADDAPQTIAPFKAWLRRPIEADTLYELLTSCLAGSTLDRPKSQ